MLFHCGLLSERPEKDATLQWVRRGYWDMPGHPPEIEHERRVWLSMPGFVINYHCHTLGVGRELVLRHIRRDYEELREDVARNWLSCTRDDAVKLSQIRPGTGDIPVLSQLAIIDDMKRGLKQAQIARDYRVHPGTVAILARGGIRFRGELPKGFKLIRS